MQLWCLSIFLAILSTVTSRYHVASSTRHRYPIKHRDRPFGNHLSSRKHGHHGLLSIKEEKMGSEKKGKNVCLTKECKTIAKIIKDNINHSVDPCENFYEYACGKFGENNPIPEGEDSWSFIEMTAKKVDDQLKGILTEKPSSTDLLNVKLGKKYYQTCVDNESKEKKGLDPLVAAVVRIGGWPMIMEPEEWEEDEYPWQKVDDYYAQLTGQTTLHTIYVYYEFSENTTKVALTLPILSSGAEHLNHKVENSKESSEDDDSISEEESKEDKEKSILKEDQRSSNDNFTETYANIITEVAMAMAEAREFEIPKDNIANEVDQMLIFLQKLYTIIKESTELENSTLSEMQEWYDSLNSTTRNSRVSWIDKIMSTFGNANVDVDEDLMLVLRRKDYFEKLRALLDETPNRVIVNYVHWNFISHIMDATNEKMRILFHNMTVINTKTSQRRSRKLPQTKEEWMKHCVSEGELIDVMSYVYVQKYFPDEIKTTATNMISYIQKEVQNQIVKSEWLDDDTKEAALEKVKKMKKHVGYPDWYHNTTIVKSHYKGLNVGPSYFENRLSYTRYAKKRMLRRLNQKNTIQDSEDYAVPLMLNALYAPFDNAMVVTAADFQDPFFALSRPSIINYAIVGAIIGHEVNHGFDDDGREYDKSGKKIEWLAEMSEAYGERVECFVEQYDDLAMTTGFVNKTSKSYGNRTRNENIADTMGLEASLGAYRINRKETNDESESVLPGLEELSTEQLFFLSYANVFCKTTEEKETDAGFDVHSMQQLRVLGPISNAAEFAKSFNCPIGSAMNPEKKCNIWK